ncbi:protein deadpan-like isoform X2 [Neocloeon triangulifer]|nr:protein deadpan-like isoform X2 [Neocloeon triangulifer]XP_059477121.1 protein deadpan-like isoform X2 [Neocloeon triangulifer]XP_059477122.1 protein deadpan-like isoform X2 [Neocloeon triangulifer]XP_059477123.1 protein deadpan-like isoform X2 [Neocloeon triangulifer]XP_059477124.1 protein deadpan-like isoform X2 [Neocloeon triangulifer]XP_059477125.1 protein deadpan-like isoform X2 [Neocloeon triangulifer]
MEKKRRARINHCLNELKSLILDAMKKDPARHSKLEKADILEMTVKHLQGVQRQQLAVAVATDPTVVHKFKTGFSECASEVSRYVARLEGVEPAVKQRLMNHLNQCVNGLQQLTPFNFGQSNATVTIPSASNINNAPSPTNPTIATPTPVQATPNASIQMPFPAGDVNNNNTRVTNSLQLIPSRLPSGELAFVLPSSSSSASGANNGVPPYFPAPVTPTVDRTRFSAFTAVQRSISPSSSHLPRPPIIVSPSSTSSGDESSSSYPCSQSPSPPQVVKPTALTLELKTLAVASTSGNDYTSPCSSKGVLDFSMKPPPPPKRHVEVLGDSSNSKIPRMAFPNINVMQGVRFAEAENAPRHATGPDGHDSMWRPW